MMSRLRLSTRCIRPISLRYFSNQGYQSIGSFHSDNLTDLLHKKEPPELPFVDASSPPTYSRDDFLLDSSWTFLNHGAFGAALQVGYQRAQHWRHRLEEQPLRFFDRELLPHLTYTTQRLATFLNAPLTRTVLLPNVTSGLNAVLQSHAQTVDSSVCVLWDVTYGSTKKMANHYYRGRVEEIALLPNIHDLYEQPEETIVTTLQQALDANPEWRFRHLCIVLDHTTSNTALTLPVARLAQILRDHLPQAWIVVDGAHGLLAQNVHVNELFEAGVDAYLTNGHKWLCAPRGVGVMCLSNRLVVHPALVSHGMDQPDLLSRFVWDGCRDYAAALAVPAVLEYWQGGMGIERMRAQCRATLQQGIQVLEQSWYQGESASLVPLDSTMLSLMALVRLPLQGDSTAAKQLQDALYAQRIEVPVKSIQNQLYVRVSSHIYNTVDDFDALAQAIRKLG